MLDNYLNQTCTINRPTAGSVDRYNANTFSSTAVASGVRCRVVEKSVKLLNPQTGEYTWVKASVLLLPAGTNVETKDEAVVDGVTYRIKQLMLRQRRNAAHHISCVVEALNA